MNLYEITGFESYSPIIEILDSKGGSFYYLQNPDQKRITFNLPEGDFIFCCDVEQLKKPLRYVCPSLPKRDKFAKIADHLDIRIEENPSKATTITEEGIIIFDPSIWDCKSIPEKTFVGFHEVGHNYYYGGEGKEYKCDLFAASEMLKRGFNPSQCFYANSFCLSDRNQERKDILFTFLKNVKCYE